MIQAFDAEKTRLYDYTGRLVHQAARRQTTRAASTASIYSPMAPGGAACCRLVNADGTLAEGAWQSLFPLFVLDGKGYYGFMAFDATPVYVEELGEEQYEWSQDSVRYGVIDDTGATVLEARYDSLSAALDGRLLVREGDAQGLIDVEGNWLYQLDTVQE